MSLIYRVYHKSSGQIFYATVNQGVYTAVTTPFEDWLSCLEQQGNLESGAVIGDGESVDVLAPVTPGKVICVGLNYAQHAQEMGRDIPHEPLIFLKPPSSIIGPERAIILPDQSNEVHHEAELAVIIGHTASKISEELAPSVVLGYCCANDITARDIQRREQRYTRAKGFDTFCPIGPGIALAKEFNPSQHTVQCRVNGIVRQHSKLNDFIFSISQVVSFISHIMTLNAGDIILTGTPAGVGPIVTGDVVEIEIDGLGVLTNSVG